MKKLLVGMALLGSFSSFASSELSCFTHYTNKSTGLVSEQSFEINSKDPRINYDGYLASINLDSLRDGGKAEMNLNFGKGILNKGKSLSVELAPLYSENPESGERVLQEVMLITNAMEIAIPIDEGQYSRVKFSKVFGADEKNVEILCGLLDL